MITLIVVDRNNCIATLRNMWYKCIKSFYLLQMSNYIFLVLVATIRNNIYKGGIRMFQLQVDEATAKQMMQQAIDERVEELAKEKYFLTYNELAEYLNISKPVIEDRLIKNGMKFYKVGSKYLFKRDEVDQFLDEITQSMTIGNNDLKFFERLKK